MNLKWILNYLKVKNLLLVIIQTCIRVEKPHKWLDNKWLNSFVSIKALLTFFTFF